MRKLPLIFLPLLLIALSACSRSPSPPTAEPPVLATQPTEQTTIPPEQINEPGQESSSQPVTEHLPEPTAPSVTEPASTAAAADTPPNTEPASQPPQPTEPPATKSPAAPTQPEPTTEPPAPPETAQPTEAPFDIDYWIGYAQTVATEKGLVLEPSAVDCWDNPISANPNCIYLERDITARLNRYAGDGDITDVWVWYECVEENRYLIYIGYA